MLTTPIKCYPDTLQITSVHFIFMDFYLSLFDFDYKFLKMGEKVKEKKKTSNLQADECLPCCFYPLP